MKVATSRLAVLGTVLCLAGFLLASAPASAAVRYVRHCYWSHGHRHCHYHRHYHRSHYRHYHNNPYCYYHRCYYYPHGWNNR